MRTATLDTLANELQALTISSLAPKDAARLRAVSKEMRRAVNDIVPPTGCYRKKSGRFQRFFDLKKRKQIEIYRECKGRDQDREYQVGVVGGYKDDVSKWMMTTSRELTGDYANKKLLEQYRKRMNMSPEFQHEYWKRVIPEMTRESAQVSYHKERHRNAIFRRRVLRLVRMWEATDRRYAGLTAMIRRTKRPYTPYEEHMYADRLMDAIIVTQIAAVFRTDVTKPIVTRRGRELTLDEKIKLVTDKCRRKYDDSLWPPHIPLQDPAAIKAQIKAQKAGKKAGKQAGKKAGKK